jgi:hypothetical protein
MACAACQNVPAFRPSGWSCPRCGTGKPQVPSTTQVELPKPVSRGFHGEHYHPDTGRRITGTDIWSG